MTVSRDFQISSLLHTSILDNCFIFVAVTDLVVNIVEFEHILPQETMTFDSKEPVTSSEKPLVYFSLKGLSHEIFTGIFWLEWNYLGLNGNPSGF